jgi:hypothetical protein
MPKTPKTPVIEKDSTILTTLPTPSQVPDHINFPPELILQQIDFPQIKSKKQHRFLMAFVNGAYTPAHACHAAQVSVEAYRLWMRKDPLFVAAMEEANEFVCQRLEREAIRRAMEGWEEPVYQKGMLVGYVRKFDSNMLQFVLKKMKPEYRERYAPPEGFVADITERLRAGMARARGEVINVTPNRPAISETAAHSDKENAQED